MRTAMTDSGKATTPAAAAGTLAWALTCATGLAVAAAIVAPALASLLEASGLPGAGSAHGLSLVLLASVLAVHSDR